jgi:hypothetical protein
MANEEKHLNDFAMCIYTTRGEKSDGSPTGADWSQAVIDALIAHNITCAAENGLDPLKCVSDVLQMAEERAMEWLPGIVFEHERPTQ